MNREEALKVIETMDFSSFTSEEQCALTIAVVALEALTESKEAILYGDWEDGKLLCPSCGNDLWDEKECGYNHCPHCGQAVDYLYKDDMTAKEAEEALAKMGGK